MKRTQGRGCLNLHSSSISVVSNLSLGEPLLTVIQLPRRTDKFHTEKPSGLRGEFFFWETVGLPFKQTEWATASVYKMGILKLSSPASSDAPFPERSTYKFHASSGKILAGDTFLS